MGSEDPSAELNGILVRSRSRYKGSRPTGADTSIEATPMLPPGPLAQHISEPLQRREVCERIDNYENERIQQSPSKSCRESAKHAELFNSASWEYRSSPTSPIALATRRNPTQGQTIQREPEFSRSLRMERGGEHPAQDQNRDSCKQPQRERHEKHVIMRKADQEFTTQQSAYEKPTIKHTGNQARHGSDWREDHKDQSNIHSVKPPTASSNPSLLNQQLMTIPTQIGNCRASAKSSTLHKRSLTHRRKDADMRDQLKRTISLPMTVEAIDVTVNPAFDAPVSAVNAGERRVRVQFDQASLSVSVTPSTTSMDIFCEADAQLSMSIDASANVLLESFKPLGLERPLRRYERIREVMNSWDNDTQNSLNIVPSSTKEIDDKLNVKSVPQSQPGETSVHMYHSNAPGSWDKRWITLRSDGQVLMKKKDGKETFNICHMSDFDIYMPTKRQMVSKIRPPKKHCFAIKSQQKSAMFLTTENFVHFFAAGDRELAMAWYDAVQEWRSWYLVNIKGEDQKRIAGSSVSQRPSSGTQRQGEHQEDVAHTVLGVQKETARCSQRQQVREAFSLRSSTTRSHDPPPTSCPPSPRKLTKDHVGGSVMARNNSHHRPSIIQNKPVLKAKTEPFAAQSLLGDMYTARWEAIAKGDLTKAPDNSHMEDNSPPGPNGQQQMSSQQQRQKPLVDLMPDYQEPPQHRKRRQVVKMEHSAGGGLIKAATGPDHTEDRQKLAATGVQWSLIQPTQYARDRHTAVSPEKGEAAFSGGLLLSASGQTKDGAEYGRGSRREKRTATEPSLNMNTEGPWAKGSLLDKVSSANRGLGHKIERAKMQEIEAPIGEGL